jgi:RluA family pseudouridine synthase
MLKHNFSVLKDESGISLAHYLKQRLSLSASKIKKAIDEGCVFVNDRKERFASYVLGFGDKIVFFQNTAEKSAFDLILFENHELIILNKPPFISSEDFAKKFPDFELLHRLDKETTGALLLAKNQKEATFLKQAFKLRQIEKSYFAVVDGLPKDSFESINYLAIKEQRNKSKIMQVTDNPNALLSITYFKVLHKLKSASLVACFPKTGRTHQIRVQLAANHHPIIGDMVYGTNFKCSFKASRVMLHAHKLSFMTSNKQKIEIIAPLYPDFLDTLNELSLPGQKITI